MDKPLHPYYLQAMGIEVWESRQQLPMTSSCSLSSLAKEVSACKRCVLHQTRTQTVFARGNPQAQLMIVGEAPGFFEDKQGLPFVGKAGILLNKMLNSIGLTENDVYIANVLKCRPPDNRDPKIEEIAACSSHLTQQIQLVNPKLIMAVGRFAGQFLLNEARPLNKMRNTLHSYESKPFIVSYHPAYLLRRPIDKGKAYQDLLRVKQLLEQ
ncbi:uracil-DNA glycosylase [Legionella septentrionalis]|uniref:Type-4 uracil-DNA glycosylase n=1 Tax=Legionella septentrionalis TaxID=2498109 RepID=A0A433JKX2_9GAMM|nr:uracil-DNA glycosylase [Legionella septentrionalis]RUQ89713.1 uracil-DNA glycosylase [Legionella septentrionalis]